MSSSNKTKLGLTQYALGDVPNQNDVNEDNLIIQNEFDRLAAHQHDDRYLTESEVNTKLAAKADAGTKLTRYDATACMSPIVKSGNCSYGINQIGQVEVNLIAVLLDDNHPITTQSQVIMTLPAGYRPLGSIPVAKSIILASGNSTHSIPGFLRVDAITGDVAVYAADVETSLSLTILGASFTFTRKKQLKGI